jgi:hypothetical protein
MSGVKFSRNSNMRSDWEWGAYLTIKKNDFASCVRQANPTIGDLVSMAF